MTREGHTLTSVTACVSTILSTGRPVSDKIVRFAGKALHDAWQNVARCAPPRDLDAQTELAPSLKSNQSYLLDCVSEPPPVSTDSQGRVIHTAVVAGDVVDLLFDGEAVAAVFESTPEAFALVSVSGDIIYAVRALEKGACVRVDSRDEAAEYVKQHVGAGAPCNIFFN